MEDDSSYTMDTSFTSGRHYENAGSGAGSFTDAQVRSLMQRVLALEDILKKKDVAARNVQQSLQAQLKQEKDYAAKADAATEKAQEALREMRSECVGLRKELAAEKRAKAQFSAKLEDLLTEKEELLRHCEHLEVELQVRVMQLSKLENGSISEQTSDEGLEKQAQESSSAQSTQQEELDLRDNDNKEEEFTEVVHLRESTLPPRHSIERSNNTAEQRRLRVHLSQTQAELDALRTALEESEQERRVLESELIRSAKELEKRSEAVEAQAHIAEVEERYEVALELLGEREEECLRIRQELDKIQGNRSHLSEE